MKVPRGSALALVFLLALPGTAHAAHSNLGGQWHLDSLSGGTPDSSGHNLTGVQVGSPQSVAGRWGNALRFPTESDYVNAGNRGELQPSTVSVLAWVRAGSTPSQVKAVVAQGATGTCSHSSYSLYTGGSADAAGLRFYIWNGSQARVSPPAANSMWDGQWHLAAGTYDGATVRLYIDGQQVGSGTSASGPIVYGLGGNNDFIIGGAQDASCIEQTNFTGDVDEVRVYNRALSAEEVAYLARSDHTSPPNLPIPGAGGGGPLPAPPPPPPPGRNLALPAIQTGGVSGGLRSYSCLPGGWADLAGDSLFQYTWWRRNDEIGGPSVPDTKMQTGGGQLYRLPRADIGKAHYCEVTARGLNGQPVRAASVPRILTGADDSVTSPSETALPLPYGNVQVRGIDVIQVTQPNFRSPRWGGEEPIFPFCGGGTPTNFHLFLGSCQTLGENPQRVPYRGVTLDARKRTFALVYVSVEDNQTPFPLRLLDVTLTGRLGDEMLGENWQLVANPLSRSLPYVSVGERTDPTGESRVLFELDPSWMAQAARGGGDDLSLDASVSIGPGLEGILPECLGERDCATDNHFRLDGIRVSDDLPSLTVKTVPMLRHNQRVTGAEIGAGYVLPSPEEVLSKTRQLFPGGERLNVLPYKGVIDIDLVEVLRDVSPYCAPFPSVRVCREEYVTTLLSDWMAGSTSNRTGFDLLMAVHHFHAEPNGPLNPGWSRFNPIERGTVAPNLIVGDARQDDGRTPNLPIKGIPHEFGHAMGAPHADTLAPDPETGRRCGGAQGGQRFELWPNDHTGRLQSAAFDNGRLRMDTFDTPMFDLMSYCSQEADAWLSAFNWTRAFNTMQDYRPVPILGSGLLAAGTRAGQAFVTGVVGSGGAKIVRVVPADPQNNPPDPDPSSSLKVRALDGSGRELALVGAKVTRTSEEREGGTFIVAIPNGSAAVELVAGGQVVDRKARTRPPTVRLLAPGGGTRVGGGRRSRLRVRWAASDPDRDLLDATIEYSANGRSGWRPVFKGPGTGSAVIPGRFLERASAARIRVRVNDGFSDAVARSGAFQAEGTPPSARIILPQSSVLPAPRRTVLQGSGLDDRNRPLRGRALTWFAGRRRLGNGERLQARLRAGRVTLRLQARDRFGRVATAVKRITVKPVALRVRTLQVRRRVAARARTLTVEVATTVPATLRAGGRSYAVGPRARRLSIALPRRPRVGVLKVGMTITAKGVRQRVLRHRIFVLRV
jgi:Concanavalin A-like lectin/glucanases superfamily